MSRTCVVGMPYAEPSVRRSLFKNCCNSGLEIPFFEISSPFFLPRTMYVLGALSFLCLCLWSMADVRGRAAAAADATTDMLAAARVTYQFDDDADNNPEHKDTYDNSSPIFL